MALSAHCPLCSRALLRLGARSIALVRRRHGRSRGLRQPVSGRARRAAERPIPGTSRPARPGWRGSAPCASPTSATPSSCPGDFLRVLSAGGGGRGRGLPYRIHERRLHANSESVTLTYIFRPDESTFPALLRPGADPPAGRGLLPAADREHQPGRAAREDRRRELAPRPPDRRPGGNAPGDRGLRPGRGPWRRPRNDGLRASHALRDGPKPHRRKSRLPIAGRPANPNPFNKRTTTRKRVCAERGAHPAAHNKGCKR